VEDCADAIVRAAASYEGDLPMNIGSGQEISVRDLAHTVARLSGFGGEILWDGSRPDGQPRRCLDTSRAKAALGWSASTSLEEGLRKTIGWYEAG
jgi:nucleoside-diphosphate-sugar epimerase